MKKYSKNLIFVILLSLVLALSACAKDEGDPPAGTDDPDSGEEDTQSVSAITAFTLPFVESETWDPITCSDGTQQVLSGLLYEGLFALDQSFNPTNELCSAYTMADDCLSYTFTIRPGVKFSDGSDLTAADVAATLKRAKTSARYGSRLAEISSVSSSGDSVSVRLSAPSNALPALLDIPIVKSSTAGNTVPLGTGPYAFTAEEAASYLSPNTAWWKGEALPVNRIELYSVTLQDNMSYLFSSRKFQLVSNDFTATNSVAYSGNVISTEAPTTLMQYIGFNCSRGVFADAELRSVVSGGINRDYTISAFLLGHAQSAEFPVSPAASIYPTEDNTSYSAELYAQEMKRIGYDINHNKRVTMIVSNTNSFKVSAAKYIAETLSLYDLKIAVKELPYEEYVSALQSGNFDMYYGEVKMSADWNLKSLVGTAGGLNYGRYTNDATDMLLSSAYSAGADTRDSAYRALLTRLRAESPIVPICFKTQSIIMHSGVVDAITPTAANAFYNFSQWQIHIKGENK